jgi:hypothetical protein
MDDLDDDNGGHEMSIPFPLAGSSRLLSLLMSFLFFHSSSRLYSRYPLHLLAVSLLLIH